MLPIILVAKDEYLNQLRSGKVYLKNSIYYQQLEEDEQRGDKFDSAIPSDLFSFPNVSNGRLTTLLTYIKSFFQYKPENTKMLSETQMGLYTPKGSIGALKKFSKTTEGNALLIWNTNEFVGRFVKQCNKFKIKCFFDSVEYIDDVRFANYKSVPFPDISKRNLIFTKQKYFSPQQEFRIAVSFNTGEQPDNAIGVNVMESIDVSMEGIEDISEIVSLQEIIDEPYIVSN